MFLLVQRVFLSHICAEAWASAGEGKRVFWDLLSKLEITADPNSPAVRVLCMPVLGFSLISVFNLLSHLNKIFGLNHMPRMVIFKSRECVKKPLSGLIASNGPFFLSTKQILEPYSTYV